MSGVAMTRQELGSLLNLLLEGERAGAKLLSAWLDELPRLEASGARRALQKMRDSHLSNVARCEKLAAPAL